MAINVTQVQAGGYTAAVDRLEQAALLRRSSPLSVRAGILPSDGTDFAVTAQGSPNMTVNVAKGQCVIPDSAGGAYIFDNDAVKVVTISASSGPNPRWDLIIARVYDNAAGDSVSTTTLALAGSAGNATVQTKTGDIEVVTGTPGSSPALPTLPNSPAGSRIVVLAKIVVGTSVTSINNGNIDMSVASTRVGFTGSAGGLLICRGTGDYPTGAVEGDEIYDQTLNTNFTWSGSAWLPSTAYMPGMPSGSPSFFGTYTGQPTRMIGDIADVATTGSAGIITYGQTVNGVLSAGVVGRGGGFPIVGSVASAGANSMTVALWNNGTGVGTTTVSTAWWALVW